MLVSKLYAPTLREVPAEAEIPSHKLMLRAGYMRKSATGMYTYLPLAQRVLQKIETIIREELNAIDSQEILMPIVQPAEIWQQSGRWDVYGAEMWRLKDRHGHDYCLGTALRRCHHPTWNPSCGGGCARLPRQGQRRRPPKTD